MQQWIHLTAGVMSAKFEVLMVMTMRTADFTYTLFRRSCYPHHGHS